MKSLIAVLAVLLCLSSDPVQMLQAPIDLVLGDPATQADQAQSENH